MFFLPLAAQTSVSSAIVDDGGLDTLDRWTADEFAMQPNQSYDDPQYRELMQNRDFRYALSLATDRETINDIAYFGQGTPTTFQPFSTKRGSRCGQGNTVSDR